MHQDSHGRHGNSTSRTSMQQQRTNLYSARQARDNLPGMGLEEGGGLIIIK